ncbi:MAG: hypothetical protein JJU22_03935 [Gammaproteobacteria bacterium]|nr:hypothetical protein [Gammaproteobacteria bacterium]
MSLYVVMDTFNDQAISRHRTLEAAVRADDRFRRAVRRANGPTSYIPTVILDPAGERIGDGHPEHDAMLQIANGLPYWS